MEPSPRQRMNKTPSNAKPLWTPYACAKCDQKVAENSLPNMEDIDSNSVDAIQARTDLSPNQV